MDEEYANDIVLLANKPAEALLHYLEWEAADIGLHVNADKTEYMCFIQRGNISTLNDPIYPTPPLGQDMTQGQFLSGV